MGCAVDEQVLESHLCCRHLGYLFGRLAGNMKLLDQMLQKRDD